MYRSLFWIKLETSCNSVKKGLPGRCFSVKFAKFLRTPFLEKSSSGCFLSLRFKSCFQRSSEQNLVRLSAINTRLSWKKYLLQLKSRSRHRRCSVNKGLQGPAQVFSCESCEIFKNTYFEKHLWTAAPENQHLSDKFTRRR